MGVVSMKSGLGGRNNVKTHAAKETLSLSLNGVRSRRPEQFRQGPLGENLRLVVSMKSGLGDRNNRQTRILVSAPLLCLNEVRSWRPEQWRGG